MRNKNESIIDAVEFNQFHSELYQSIKSGVEKLSKTNRLITSTVVHVIAYKLKKNNTPFNNANVNALLKVMVFCTSNEPAVIEYGKF